MLGLVIGPVLIGVVIVVAVLLTAGPSLTSLIKELVDQIKDALCAIKDTWRSE